MNKTLLILQREYLIRVKKKSFIIMTFLGPLLMAALMVVPIVLATMRDVGSKSVVVLDETGWFAGKFESGEQMSFIIAEQPLDSLKKEVIKGKFDFLVHIPATQLNVPSNAELYSIKQPSVSVRSYVRNVIKTEVENRKLMASGIDPEVIRQSKTTVNVLTYQLGADGELKKSYTDVQSALGFISALLIYFFIFLFGSQVMRGVIEEKTNRIIEVIVSSVKPFQLMLGKVLGIALVGLTQFLLWVILTMGIYLVLMGIFGSEIVQQPAAMSGELIQQVPEEQMDAVTKGMSEVFEVVRTINFPLILFSFAFYFLGGYLLYAALFAAIGSAVDNETDVQQFMLPVSLPLILGIVMMNFLINNTDSSLAFWLSIIPLTSPIVMMVRIPFGVPVWELTLSMAVLVGGFLFTTWIAARIYRTGILMYGKKVSWGELWKWLRY
ncbi:MAG: ABC transporter permease [Bacteroidia bacterium]|jgi:ABC-2 type transport system permease protein|nr:ABC transporter permease [Bacteroidia bacterium]